MNADNKEPDAGFDARITVVIFMQQQQ